MNTSNYFVINKRLNLYAIVTSIIILVLPCRLSAQLFFVADSFPDTYMTFNLNGKQYKLPYSSNYSIDSVSNKIIHAVIGIHGASYDPYSVRKSLQDASFEANAYRSTIVVAPAFFINLC